MKKKTWKTWTGRLAVTLSALAFLTAPFQAEAAAGPAVTITVQADERTLQDVVKRYGGNIGAWKFTNRLATNELTPGQKLTLPFPALLDHEMVLELLTEENPTLPELAAPAPVEQVTPMKSSAASPVASVEQEAPAPAPPALPTVAGMPYSKVLTAHASAYGPGNINWQWGGRTRTGTQVREGVIAVDPSVIPLGTKVFITGYSTPLLPAGGFIATAEDTGGAIKGSRIDIYINGTQTQLRQFGKQAVQVYLLT